MPISVTQEAYNAAKNAPPVPPRAKKPRLNMTLEEYKETESRILDAVPVLNIELLTMESRPWVVLTGDINLEYSKVGKEHSNTEVGLGYTSTYLWL